MARSDAMTVRQYLDALPQDRRRVVSAVRDAILERLPAGYVESMSWGMITYEIPLEDYPDTYNGKPLGFAALAAQENHYALHLMSAYSDPETRAALERGFEEAGKKLDMGKSCVRFRELEDLSLDVIGEVIAGCPPDRFIELHEAGRSR